MKTRTTPEELSPLFREIRRFVETRDSLNLPAKVIHDAPQAPSSKAILFINGIANSSIEIDAYCNIIRTNSPDHLYKIANVSNGFIQDLVRAAALKLGAKTTSSELTCQTLETIASDPDIKHVRVICHSEGALVLKIALESLRDKSEANFQALHKKLSIVAIGPAFFFDTTYASKCKIHVSLIDPVPFLLNFTYILSYLIATWNLLWRKMRQDFTPVKRHNVYFYSFYSSMFTEHGLRHRNYAKVFVDAITKFNDMKVDAITEFNDIGTVSTTRPQQSVSI